MSVNLLVSSMNEEPMDLLTRLNVKCDSIIVNQCGETSDRCFTFGGHDILWLNRNERGIGKSRNTALMRSVGDIVLFADDDCQYRDDIQEVLESSFRQYNCDILIFNYKYVNDGMRVHSGATTRVSRVGCLNYMKYGAIRMAVRRDFLMRSGVMFNLLFGGGAKYSCGEDTIFLHDCLKAGARVKALPIEIGKVDLGESSWFEGYGKKYCYDRGALHARVSGSLHYLVSFRHCVRLRKKLTIGVGESLRLMFRGAIDFLRADKYGI